MPKVNNTLNHRRKALYKRIHPDNVTGAHGVLFGHFFANTAHLKPTAEQMQMINDAYSRWFNSWVEDEARVIILQEKL